MQPLTNADPRDGFGLTTVVLLIALFLVSAGAVLSEAAAQIQQLHPITPQNPCASPGACKNVAAEWECPCTPHGAAQHFPAVWIRNATPAALAFVPM